MLTTEELLEILGPQGSVARHHANYEFRPGQVQMAEAVAAAIGDRHHLCVEAGTGTGKTLAYLIPAIFSGRRVIISTATKNLQEQLFFKDLPFLENALGRPLSVCYMKGRSNYLCLKKLSEINSETYLFSPHDPEYLRVIRAWAAKTDTGDRAELRELPEELPLWQKLDARRDTCTGQKCDDFESCFVTRVRQRALESDLVVVNHHLFFADLALRQGDFGAVLPEYSVAIFDEAHELEDIATQYFGVMISNYRIEELVRDTDRAIREAGEGSEFIRNQLTKLMARSLAFFSRFISKEGRFQLAEFGPDETLRRGIGPPDENGEAYRALQSDLALIAAGLDNLPMRSDTLDALIRRCEELRDALVSIMESDSMEHVYWYECRGRGVFLWATPIRVADVLREKLFQDVDTVVLTSATLSTGGNFNFVRARLGLDRTAELILGSHFDFTRQSIFYVPRDLPEPREPDWAAQACRVLEKVLDASRGRAFLLFTSYAQMQQVHRTLRERLPYPVLMQGERSKAALLEEFRAKPHSVLFATNSFWQGVDVQGEALSCVVIDKLPFSVPSDPVTAARIRHLNQTGGNAFYDYQIPEAVILLKQGLGRLIRSRNDRGILVLLDKRVVTKGYGRIFLTSIPPAPLTHSLEELRNFFAAPVSLSEETREAPGHV